MLLKSSNQRTSLTKTHYSAIEFVEPCSQASPAKSPVQTLPVPTAATSRKNPTVEPLRARMKEVHLSRKQTRRTKRRSNPSAAENPDLDTTLSTRPVSLEPVSNRPTLDNPLPQEPLEIPLPSVELYRMSVMARMAAVIISIDTAKARSLDPHPNKSLIFGESWSTFLDLHLPFPLDFESLVLPHQPLPPIRFPRSLQQALLRYRKEFQRSTGRTPTCLNVSVNSLRLKCSKEKIRSLVEIVGSASTRNSRLSTRSRRCRGGCRGGRQER